nr:NADH-quinone oxidoreductase subunit N [Desulfobacterales bacterium]
IKRMLAYSSIAHAGYIMVAMVAGSGLGTSSIMFYILAYAFMNMGAFGVVIMLGSRGQLGEDIDDYRSIGYLRPLLGLSMTIFMFSLAGIPPTAGFVAKFFIFSAAVKAGFIWLTIIGVLNSVLSLYYYLRVIVYMYMYEPEDKAEKASLIYSPALIVALIISVIATLQIGIFPSFFYNLAKESILSFL